MTLQQGIELAQKAKAKGYATRALKGKVQFIVLDKDYNVVTEVTDYLFYDDAKKALAQ